tara:strand:+ start:70 stop:480 length:411 start_codon:yes stop_codon:yes gene_type:complete
MKRAGKWVYSISFGICYLLLDANTVLAQITESDKEYVPGTNETSQLITSSFEVRRAVIALIAIAVLAVVGLVYYWRKTGQWARDRFVEEHGEDAIKKKKRTFGSRRFSNALSRMKDKSLFPVSAVESPDETNSAGL